MNTKKFLSVNVAAAILVSAITLPTASAAANLSSSFSLDFEGKVTVPLTYKDDSYTVVTGGDSWTGSGNWSLAKAASDYSLDGQALSGFISKGTKWDDTNAKTMLADSAVFSGFGGSYTYGQLRESGKLLTDIGDDVFVGLTSSLMPALVGSNQTNYDDIAVVADPEDESNNVLKLAPPAMENDANTGSSLFGKNYIDVVGKSTKFSSKVYIDQEAGSLRLMLVRDVDFLKSMEHCLEYGEMKKTYDYMSWLKKNGDGNPGYWYDAVCFENGTIYLDGENVGEYASDIWYSVDYYLDLTDITSPKQVLVVKNPDGAIIAKKTAGLTVGGTSTLPNISQNSFELAEDANSYGLVFAATSSLFNPDGGTYPQWNGNRAQSGTVAYLDNIAFAEGVYKAESVNDPRLTSKFGLGFEGKEAAPATYKDGNFTLVTGGESWTGSGNWSLAKAASDYSLDGQSLSVFSATGATWDNIDAKIKLADNTAFAGFGGSYTYGELKQEGKLLTDIGDDIFVGLTSSLMPALVGSNQINYDDIAIVADPEDESNNVLKLAPPAMENSTNTGSSLFGKNYVDIVGKSTKLSSKVYIDQEAGSLRLMLVRDIDFLKSMEHCLEYGQMRKKYDYMSWLKKNGDGNPGYWYDAVCFENGVIYFDGENVGTYTGDTWYSVDYYLDLTNFTSPKQVLVVKDATGATVTNKTTGLTVGGTSTLPNISQNSFALSEKANSYGLMFAATSKLFKSEGVTYPQWNGNRAQSGTVAYLDNITFGEDAYEDDNTEDGVIEIAGTVEDGKYTVCIKNGTDETYAGAMVILAAYDSTDHSFKGAKIGSVDVFSNSVSKEITLDLPQGRDCYYKVFVWDKDTSEPLAECKSFEGPNIISYFVTYPSFSTKAVTFNINDAAGTDAALIKLMHEYGINATFGLTDETADFAIYNHDNFEIANHTTHIEMYLDEEYVDDNGNTITPPAFEECTASIETAEAAITNGADVTPVGLVWPYMAPEERDFYKNLILYAETNNYQYIRDSRVTNSYELPEDWNDWGISAWVQKDNTESILALAEEYKGLDAEQLYALSIAGNGTDMTEAELLEFYEALFETLSDEEIWKATNAEICEYIKASSKLEITDDYIYNPTNVTIYMLVNGEPCVAEPESYAQWIED